MINAPSHDRLLVTSLLKQYPAAREDFNSFLDHCIDKRFKGSHKAFLNVFNVRTLDRIYRMVQNEERLYQSTEQAKKARKKKETRFKNGIFY